MYIGTFYKDNLINKNYNKGIIEFLNDFFS